MDQRIRFRPFPAVKPFQADTELRMEDHAAVQILFIERFSHATYKYNRKLQSLTFVNTHQPHGIFLFTDDLSLAVINIIFH